MARSGRPQASRGGARRRATLRGPVSACWLELAPSLPLPPPSRDRDCGPHVVHMDNGFCRAAGRPSPYMAWAIPRRVGATAAPGSARQAKQEHLAVLRGLGCQGAAPAGAGRFAGLWLTVPCRDGIANDPLPGHPVWRFARVTVAVGCRRMPADAVVRKDVTRHGASRRLFVDSRPGRPPRHAGSVGHRRGVATPRLSVK